MVSKDRFKRAVRFWWQRRTRGFDDAELWNLDFTFCEFIIPRLKAFRSRVCSYPVPAGSLEEWEKILDKMIFALELWVNRNGWVKDEDKEKYEEGKDLFFKYFFTLWD
jgi:hypothetical protein